MSILIKGMEIPKNCDECYIREKDTCPLTKMNVTGWGRPLNCPLIELPPHGDLIDIDRLLLEVNNLIDSEKSILQIVSEAEKLIRNAPIVVESEDGDGKD